jgi:hypothetical protein
MKKHLATLVMVGMVAQLTAQITNIIPVERMGYWTPETHVGVIGGIPTGLTIYTNLGVNSGDNISIPLQAALSACPSGQVVVLPAGQFFITNSIYNGNGTVLRGAGRTNTFLHGGRFRVDNDNNTWAIYLADFAQSGLTKGSTNIALTNTADFTVGKLVMLAQYTSTSQTDTPLIASVTGTNNQYAYLRKVVHSVVAKTDTNITIWPPLHADISARHVRVKPMNYSVGRIGLEDMTVTLTNVQNGITWAGTRNSWVKNVRFYWASNRSIALAECSNIEVRDCILDELNHGGSNGAGLLMDTVCSSLIENNVILNSFPCVEINAGSAGNVVGYNFLLNTNGLMEIDSNHGPHNSHNLFEGNISGRFMSDGYFGSESDGTVFRNWLHGTHPGVSQMWVLSLKRFTRNYSLVGNIFGHPTLGTMTWDGTVFGQPNLGNGDDNGSDAPPWADWGTWPGASGFQEEDTNVLATTIRAVNYDFFTDSIPTAQQNTNSIPDSLYRAAKPSWFGSLTWPPFTSTNVNAAMDYTNTVYIPAQQVFLTGSSGGGDAPAASLRRLRVKLRRQ